MEELEQRYFMIQDVINEYDEQDIKLGMNTYYIEKNDQLFSTYDGVLKIQWGSDKIIF